MFISIYLMEGLLQGSSELMVYSVSSAKRPGSTGDYILVITGRDGFVVVELLAVC